MSEPSYRITTEHKPSLGKYIKWEARIVRLSDGESEETQYGTTEAEVLNMAENWIAAVSVKRQDGGVYFATEDGVVLDQPVKPESIRA